MTSSVLNFVIPDEIKDVSKDVIKKPLQETCLSTIERVTLLFQNFTIFAGK